MTKGKTIAIVVAACGIFGLLLIVFCAGLLYVGFKNTDANVSPRIDAMFSAIEDKTFADTYETEITQELRDITSKEQYASLGNAIRVRLGKLESKSLHGFKMRQFNADSYIDVSYSAKFENGEGTIIAQLKMQDGTWKFMTFRVNSPVFEQDIATAQCPSCGEPHKANAHFCPSCGVEIVAATDEESSQDQTQSSAPATE